MIYKWYMRNVKNECCMYRQTFWIERTTFFDIGNRFCLPCFCLWLLGHWCSIGPLCDVMLWWTTCDLPVSTRQQQRNYMMWHLLPSTALFLWFADVWSCTVTWSSADISSQSRVQEHHLLKMMRKDIWFTAMGTFCKIDVRVTLKNYWHRF